MCVFVCVFLFVCVSVYILQSKIVMSGGNSVTAPHGLLNVHLECAPAMEAFGETSRFLVLHGEEEFARPFRLFDSHVLYINLGRFICQLDLNLTATWSHPEKDMFPIIEYHDIIISQIILTKVCTLLGHRIIASLIGAPKESRIIHIIRIRIVWLATAKRHPKEILRLVALVQYLCRGYILDVYLNM